VGEFREGVWMTSYEASVFLEEANLRLPVCLPADPHSAMGEVAPAFALRATAGK
jgi:hypothetical protein